MRKLMKAGVWLRLIPLFVYVWAGFAGSFNHTCHPGGGHLSHHSFAYKKCHFDESVKKEPEVAVFEPYEHSGNEADGSDCMACLYSNTSKSIKTISCPLKTIAEVDFSLELLHRSDCNKQSEWFCSHYLRAPPSFIS